MFCRCWSHSAPEGRWLLGQCHMSLSVSHTCHRHRALSDPRAESQPCLTSVAMLAAAPCPCYSLKAKDGDCRVPPALSGLWPSNNASPAPSKPQPTAPLSFIPAHGCILGLLKVPGYRAGLWSCPFVAGNTNTVLSLCKDMNLCCNPMCFSHQDSCTCQLFLIPVPTAPHFSHCCTHRGEPALLPTPLTLRSH